MARVSNQHPRERRREALNHFFYTVLPWIVICICIVALMFVLKMIGAQGPQAAAPKDMSGMVHNFDR